MDNTIKGQLTSAIFFLEGNTTFAVSNCQIILNNIAIEFGQFVQEHKDSHPDVTSKDLYTLFKQEKGY